MIVQKFFENIDSIKSSESNPQIVKLFDENEIKQINDFYSRLPLAVYNEKQKIKKKHWLLNFDKNMDNLIVQKINKVLENWEVDNMYCDQPAFGIFHESFFPLKLHVDSGRDKNTNIYKQILIPLSDMGDTIIFEPRWYGPSSSFTIDKDELSIKDGYNLRTNEHLGEKEFDREIHQKYLSHENIENLKGLKVKEIYKWELGDAFVFDRTFIHCSSTLKKPKTGLTIFFKKTN
jgi:hypothetical protein